MPNTMQRAIEIVAQRYSVEEWSSMHPKLRTAAIYEVLRRLDAEALALSRAQAGQSHGQRNLRRR
jgi:hypothetical protein